MIFVKQFAQANHEYGVKLHH